MRKLSFFAIFIASVSYGQISLTSFCFLNKNKIGEGVGVFYNLPNTNKSIGLQFKNSEMWDKITLKTFSIQYCFQENIPGEIKTKWFLSPATGVVAGFGTSSKNDRETYSVLKNPYFFGVILELGEGLKLSNHLALIGFVKIEGMAGIITNKNLIYDGAKTNSDLWLGIRLTRF